jgi:Transglutaminase-like superfamily
MRIRESVYWRECDDLLIILDMQSGSYFALGPPADQVWKDLASSPKDGQPAPHPDRIGGAEDAFRALTLRTLQERGLIESDEPSGSVRATKSKLIRKIFRYLATGGPSQTPIATGRWDKALLLAQAYFLLILIDIGLWRLGLNGLFMELVRASSESRAELPSASNTNDEIDWLCEISLAAFRWYRPGIACIHRALNIFLLLRRHGVPVEFCVGIEPRPFESHAWTECQGRVLGDSRAFCNGFRVIARIA